MNNETLKSVYEILTKVKELFSDQNCWTTNALARDKLERAVPPWSQKACKWCLVGAIEKLSPCDTVGRDCCIFLGNLHQILFLGDFNDTYGYEDVIKLLDDSISQLKELLENDSVTDVTYSYNNRS